MPAVIETGFSQITDRSHVCMVNITTSILSPLDILSDFYNTVEHEYTHATQCFRKRMIVLSPHLLGFTQNCRSRSTILRT